MSIELGQTTTRDSNPPARSGTRRLGSAVLLDALAVAVAISIPVIRRTETVKLEPVVGLLLLDIQLRYAYSGNCRTCICQSGKTAGDQFHRSGVRLHHIQDGV